jgi:uncharacterized alpha/beta hydrolase family protein
VIQKRICSIILVTIWCLFIISNKTPLYVKAQQPAHTHLPILLIHGYGEAANIWNSWKSWMKDDHLSNIYSITFQNDDDRCGSSEQHATELNSIVNKILNETGEKKVNIVAHSKGGLDARWYIANSSIDKVANLIMIGTPNAGSPAAVWDATGCPLGSEKDLLPGSAATKSKDQPLNTKYYTIAGDWLPNVMCFNGFIWTVDGGNCFINGKDDGLVAVDSVQSSSQYSPLGSPFPYSHNQLLEHKDVYEKVLPILNK